MPMKAFNLPLLLQTPKMWATQVLSEPIKLLNDHAYLEKKAAANALDLVSAYPQKSEPKGWTRCLIAVALDEVEHLTEVMSILRQRKADLARGHTNPYALALRKLVRSGKGPLEVVDRLLVSSLIELRSCERFQLLGKAAKASDLKKFYQKLYASEHGHYKVFLKFAGTIISKKEVEIRWKELLECEAQIIESQKPTFTMHSWWSKE